MQPIAIVAVGAISPLGTGEAAFAVGAVGERPGTAVGRDDALTAAGLARPIAARAPFETLDPDRARGLLAGAAEMLVKDLDRVLPGWRARRLALCIGSSAGGMPSLEHALGARSRSSRVDASIARCALYDGPLSVLRSWFDAPVVQVLAACASSTVALGLGARWLDANLADLVIAGGYDALSDFVATGFEALGATTASELKPFRTDRDGMALGEGAALVALARASETRRAYGYVLGFSVTNDAAHVTAPDPEGRGLARAARAALDDAATPPSDIDLVSAHATATPHNDRAEARAITEVLGGDAPNAVVHPFKATIGHCLGASGALEALAALGAMRDGVLPAARSDGPIEPGFSSRLLTRNEAGVARACLKLSSGFGGSNAALVVVPTLGGSGSPPLHATERPPETRARRTVRVLAEGQLVTEPSLDAIGRFALVDPARTARLSSAGALAATAVASALAACVSLERSRAGVIVGTSVACLEENEAFDRVRRERGPRAVEPRRFSRTSPNLPAGECAIAFGFLGPAFAMGGGPSGPLEALLVGADLVAAGDADYVVVVSCDEVGTVAGDLFSAAGLSPPPHGARAVVMGSEPTDGAVLERRVIADMLQERPGDHAGAALFAEGLLRATFQGRSTSSGTSA